MTGGEAVLLRVRTGAGSAGGPGLEIGVAALADVGVAALAAALAELAELAGLAGLGGPSPATTDGAWVLAPADGPPAWPPEATLRGLGVLDGTAVVLARSDSGGVSAARS